MPWSHCERDDIADDTTCPACGITKAQWTVQWNATRTFRVGRNAATLNVELLDGEGAPLAWERLVATLPDGQQAEATLDESGRAHIPAPAGARATLWFPDLPRGAVTPPGTATVLPAAGPDGPDRFEAPVGRKQAFRLDGVLTEFRLAPDGGVSLVGVPYALRLPDGTERRGHVDPKLRVRLVTPKGIAGAKVQLDLDLPEGHAILSDADGDGGLEPAMHPTPGDDVDLSEWDAWGLEKHGDEESDATPA